MNERSRYYRTSDLARALGVHVNTVRLYETWGLIPPVERAPNGYRRFTQAHMDCMRLARCVYGSGYAGRGLRRAGLAVIERAVAGDLGGAVECAYDLAAHVRAEQAQAEAAVNLLERWASGIRLEMDGRRLPIAQAARLLGVSVDVLRNWERNGLICVPRNPHNHYRQYGSTEIARLRVIRMLSRSGYSHMAILRMLTQLDTGLSVGSPNGQSIGLREDLRAALDTPRPDEDVYTAADRWLSTLAEQERMAADVIALLDEMIAR